MNILHEDYSAYICHRMIYVLQEDWTNLWTFILSSESSAQILNWQVYGVDSSSISPSTRLKAPSISSLQARTLDSRF